MFLRHPMLNYKPSEQFAEINSAVYQYVVLNLFTQLNINAITAENIHHIMDGLVALRDGYFAIGFYDLVDQVNFCLDDLAKFIPEVTENNRYFYRSTNYREPKPENIKYFLNPPALDFTK